MNPPTAVTVVVVAGMVVVVCTVVVVGAVAIEDEHAHNESALSTNASPEACR
jgi:hypothetical protein